MPESKPIAVLASDLHLSHTAPSARTAEPDWYAAMERTLDQVGSIIEKCGDVPFILAGDIFDRWYGAPGQAATTLVNFAIEHLPKCFAIPGQHDLPNHRMGGIKKAAYWTLVESGQVTHLDGPTRLGSSVVAHPFPWGEPIVPIDGGSGPDSTWVHLAVIHAYVHTIGHSYTGAPADQRLASYGESLRGYDAAVFGDNHKGFAARSGDCNVLNSGTMMCRASDERVYQPTVGILMSDGLIERWMLNTDEDIWIDAIVPVAPAAVSPEVDSYLDELLDPNIEIGEDLDYRQAIENAIREGVPDPVANLLRESIA